MSTTLGPRTTVPRVFFRYVTGRPLDGRRRTDCTFFRAGTRTADPLSRPWRWSYLPGWKRAAWRLGVPAVSVLTGTAYAAEPVLTEAGLGTLAASGGVVGAVRTSRAVRTRHHRRTYVRPLARVLGRQLGYPDTRPADEWLTVPLSFRDPDYSRDRTADPDDPDAAPDTAGHDGEIVVKLPDVMPDAPDLQRTIVRTVAVKLGIPAADLDARWVMVGATPEARFRRAPRPPRAVKYAAVAEAIEAARDGAPVLGIGARDRVVSIDLDTDAPHVAVSCGSGAGKSVLLRGLIAQFLHHGTHVLICDAKQTSQKWCKDLPGVTYCRTGQQMHDAIIAFADEVKRRSEIVANTPADDETIPDVGPRMVLVFEEQNIGMQMLAEYWQQIRTKDDPKRSPAMSALDYILCAGREFKAHVISIAQMFTVQAGGGNPAARENYGIRILARATRNAWLMLAPEAGPPYPKSSRIRGRMHMVLAGDPTEVQTAFLTVTEARTLATAGAPVTVPPTWTTRDDQARERGHGRTGTPEPAEPARYTLAEAAREEWCPLGYDALKKFRQRAGDRWPNGVMRGARETWTEAELRAVLPVREVAESEPADTDAA